MAKFSSDIAHLFEESERRGERYLSLLRREGDLVSVVLRGHLIMEELLYRTVQSHCESPEHLDEARLRFPQLVALAKSLDKLPAAPPSLWASLAKLNTLRNSLAHSLELPDLDKRVVAFVEATLGHARVAALGPSSNSKEAVVTSLCFVLGQLEVVGVFTEALEWLIVNQLSNPTE